MSYANRNGVAPASPKPAGHIDPRGPRFGAWITSALLLIGVFLALIGSSANGTIGSTSVAQRALDPGFLVIGAVALLFAWSLVSAPTQPIQAIFRAIVQPRLSPPAEWEDLRPPRFAQAVGLVVTGIGLVLHLVGVPWALVIAGGAAFIAAALNATIGFCLGCEIYLLLSRAGVIRTRASA